MVVRLMVVGVGDLGVMDVVVVIFLSASWVLERT